MSQEPGGPPVPPRPLSAAQLANAAELRTKLGVTRPAAVSQVKIAILDYGFDGLDGQRPYLPPGTTVVEHYDPEFVLRNKLGEPDFRKSFLPGNAHGRLMAQVVWGLTGRPPDGPRFFLLNANGPTLLRRAVRYAVEQRVDIILFSGHFEGGGNYDGLGAINAVVDEAIRAGIIWINAAGNHGGRVYNGPVRIGPDGFARFGADGQRDHLRLRNRVDENKLTITLTWNDYRQVEDAGTSKDLDLILEDAQGRTLGVAQLKQIGPERPAQPHESRNPRERLIVPDVPADSRGYYRLRVRANSANFTPTDRLRILVAGSREEPFPDPYTGAKLLPLQLLDATDGEEIYPPADHPRVITVGETGEHSARGPTADRRLKPDVLLPVLPTHWSNGEVTSGTSYAAACVAGAVCVLKAEQPSLTANHLHAWFARLRREGVSAARATPTKRPEPAFWRAPSPAELSALVTPQRVVTSAASPAAPARMAGPLREELPP